jgi:GlpG protein
MSSYGAFMRQIGSLAQEDAARAFGDYLLALGIANSVEQAGDAWAVWVENDDHLDRARAELEEFSRSPDQAKYRHAALEASAIRVREDRKQQRLRDHYVDVRTSSARGAHSVRPLTLILVLISLAVGAASWFGSAPAADRGQRSAPVDILQYLRISSEAPPGADRWQGLSQIAHGQVWRLVTPIFIHFGIVHLLFNMLWLLDLGAMIERQRGVWFLALLVLAAAIPSNLAQYHYAGAGFGGMSGVVYALFGYVWMKSRFAPQDGLHLPQTTVFIMLAWLFICMTGRVGHIANTAHVVGLLIGMAVGGGRYWWRRLSRRF